MSEEEKVVENHEELNTPNSGWLEEPAQEPIEEITTENLPENNGEPKEESLFEGDPTEEPAHEPAEDEIGEEQPIENLPESEPQPELEAVDLNTIKAFIPKKLNISRHGEWIFQIGTLCYGVSCRKTDNKMLITYNIDPNGLHPDFFSPVDVSEIPARVFELFQQKLSTDIMRLDNMMNNLIMNKSIVGKLFNFAEQNKTNGVEGMEKAQAYSDEDAQKDKQAEYMQTRNMRRNLQQWKPKRKKRK